MLIAHLLILSQRLQFALAGMPPLKVWNDEIQKCCKQRSGLKKISLWPDIPIIVPRALIATSLELRSSTSKAYSTTEYYCEMKES